MRNTDKYIFGGERWISASELCSATGFNQGLQQIDPEILEAAAQRGNRVHDWCERFVLGEKPPTPPIEEEQVRCSAFVDWLEGNAETRSRTSFQMGRPSIIAVEKVVRAESIKCCGQLDILIKDPDDESRLSIVDIKTGNSTAIMASYPIQQAVYSLAVREMNSLDYNPRRFILQLPKSGTYCLKELDNDADFDVLRAAAVVAWRLVETGEVKL